MVTVERARYAGEGGGAGGGGARHLGGVLEALVEDEVQIALERVPHQAGVGVVVLTEDLDDVLVRGRVRVRVRARVRLRVRIRVRGSGSGY